MLRMATSTLPFRRNPVEVAFAGGGIENVRIAVDAAGRVLVGGTITRSGPNKDFAIGRLRANGSIDIGFGYEGLRTVGFDLVADGGDRAFGIFPQADGTILMLGVAEVADQIVARSPPAIVRLTAAGNSDPSFGTNGRLVVGGSPWANPLLHITVATQQRDGKLLFGGYCLNCPDTYRAVAVRLTAAGALDPSFGTVGWSSIPLSVANPRFEAMHVDDRGSHRALGTSSSSSVYTPLVVRMTSTGAVDATFGGGSGSVSIADLPSPFLGNAVARAIAIDRDHSMILALSDFTPVTINPTGLVRLFANGTRDMSYAGSGLRNLTLENGSRILELALRSDRRLIAAGWIDHTGGGKVSCSRACCRTARPTPSFDGNGVLRTVRSQTTFRRCGSNDLVSRSPWSPALMYRQIAISGLRYAVGPDLQQREWSETFRPPGKSRWPPFLVADRTDCRRSAPGRDHVGVESCRCAERAGASATYFAAVPPCTSRTRSVSPLRKLRSIWSPHGR